MSHAALVDLLAAPPALPVAAGLDELDAAVRTSGAAVLQSPPGSGKTTLVPPALAVALGGRVVVTQPRRIAARAAARRLAGLLGEPVGRTAGFAVRGDRQTGPETLVEFVTAGTLLRRLQHDPELPGVSAVVLDEVHERQIDGDLLLAMLVEARAALREDLAVVAMSATVEADRVAELLGTSVPVVTVPGALHPVSTVWCPEPRTAPRLTPTGTSREFLGHVTDVLGRALQEQAGDVLVFLPGAREVDDVVRRARAAWPRVDVLPLHGRLPAAEQDRALQPSSSRRVIVSTAVAESSLTVPGVRVVVDAGLVREPRTDHHRGLAGLVTRSVSRAGAEQRAGRAGRQGPGTVYRCWSEAEHARLARHPSPEILTADLTGPMLELALWGAPGGAGLALLDAPPPAAAAAALAVLGELGAVTSDGAVTARGRAIAEIGSDPRLARALLDGATAVGPRVAAETVAMLAADGGPDDVDLAAALRRRRSTAGRGSPWRREADRWERIVARRDQSPRDEQAATSGGTHGVSLDLAVGIVTALAHPDRIARKRPGSDRYLMAGGAGARLPGGALAGSEWLAVAEATRSPGQPDALVRSAVPIDEATAREAGASLLGTADDVAWRDGRLVSRRVVRLGAIELSAEPLPRPPADLVAAAVQDGLRTEGLDLVPWPPAAISLRRRLAFLHEALGEPWPDVSDAALEASVPAWLGPDLDGVRTGRDLRRLDTTTALRRLLPWPEAARLDVLAPERVTVPTGSAVRVNYADPDRPTLAVRLQEVFGWQGAPALADGRVPLVLELLSPARRPAAVTADLAGFWRTGYPQVRSELRGRYPKHPWPEDPAAAAATTRTKKASRG
ncbi:ATP-dependent helicase HrpB [Isoptericola sp. S6320L]|uniref:ATP-dependent helicase HrpB n=1 Tax=Isoptericola sp. S6320L TaxID=2926411 RepID=UPI001FF3B2CA|nr:ATP-dependent helicase HrpB [Isoptericola sp. S6320L]MCK0117372.1 ATP-dependent helicase HrpB [Isoptericola sp. S6320L]